VGIRGELKSALELTTARAGTEATIEERASPIDDDFGGIKIVFGAEAIASRASTIGRIEAEGARLEDGNREATVWARKFFGVDVFLAANDSHGDEA